MTSRSEKILEKVGIRLTKNTSDGQWEVQDSEDANALSCSTQQYDCYMGTFVRNVNKGVGNIICDNSNATVINEPVTQNVSQEAVTTTVHNNPSKPSTSTNNCNIFTNNQEDESSGSSVCDDSDNDPNFVMSSEADIEEPHSNNENNDIILPNDQENIMPLKTRKKRANPVLWKRNQSKLLRNTGQAYQTLKTKIPVSSKEVRPPCGLSCRLKCGDTFTVEERSNIFKKYWELGEINKQRQFIFKSIEFITPKYRYPVVRNGSYRRNNCAFHFERNNCKIRVCKIFYLATLDITNRTIRTVIAKSQDGFLEHDKRGKHQKLVISERIKAGVRAHISSIPAIDSHYMRANTSKLFIDGSKTVADLYRDYKADCIADNKEYSSLAIYRNIFNFEYNLSFFQPKKDLCQTCESFKNLTNEAKQEQEATYKSHHEEKDLSRKEKGENKEKIDKLHVVACFDLQAAFPTPKGEISTFYYKSKLSTYNFTICNLQKSGLDEIHCYIWHEGEGGKGSIEIGSCLLNYLEQVAASVNDSNLELTFFSDNCGGQGKNKFIITAYLYAVSKYKIKSITHKFLVVGHTQNEGDACHSLIEKNIKRAMKSGPIYVPSQFSAIIRTARKTGKPLMVHEIDHDFFLDLKHLTSETCVNFNIDEQEQKFNFNDICVIKVEKNSPNRYFFKTSYKDKTFRAVNVKSKTTRKSLKGIQNMSLRQAYPGPHAISKKKYDDLQTLVKMNLIPHCHQEFFNSLQYT